MTLGRAPMPAHDYESVVELMRPLVIKHLKDDWSVQVACRRAGLNWLHAREILMRDHEFEQAYRASLKKVKRGWPSGRKT